MTVERAPSLSSESIASEDAPRQRVKQRIGKHTLMFEGFTPMGTVESRYSSLRYELESKIIDQPFAIDAIIDALERSEIRLPNDKQPIANLAFLGPTGVGKSETAKVLSQQLGKGLGNLIKIDCSNFSHGHEVAALTGSPPGYIGHDKVPVLNKNVVEQPGTVVLFDEIEKGSPELYNLMLQIMGDGELKLNTGVVTSFKDTVIVLTSNLGAKEMKEQLSKMPFGLGAQKEEPSKDRLEHTARSSFEKFFKPEFVNRLNKMVVFHPLSREGLGRVLDVKLTELNKEYEKQLGARVTLSDATRDHLIELALKEPHMGARPLIRALQDNVQTIFGRYVGGGHISEGTHVRVFHISEAPANYVGKGELIFTAKKDATIKKEAPAETAPIIDWGPLAMLTAGKSDTQAEEYEDDAYDEEYEDEDESDDP